VKQEKNDIQSKFDELKNKYVQDIQRQDNSAATLSDKLLKAHKESNDLKKDLNDKSSRLETMQLHLLEIESKMDIYKEQIFKINRQKDD